MGMPQVGYWGTSLFTSEVDAYGHQVSVVLTLPDAVTLGGAYNEGGACPVGLRVDVICCSGR